MDQQEQPGDQQEVESLGAVENRSAQFSKWKRNVNEPSSKIGYQNLRVCFLTLYIATSSEKHSRQIILELSFISVKTVKFYGQ